MFQTSVWSGGDGDCDGGDDDGENQGRGKCNARRSLGISLVTLDSGSGSRPGRLACRNDHLK